jgi:hypothetical protein
MVAFTARAGVQEGHALQLVLAAGVVLDEEVAVDHPWIRTAETSLMLTDSTFCPCHPLRNSTLSA